MPRGTTGTITAIQGAVSIGTLGLGVAGVQITGTFSGTITFEVSVNGTDFVAVNSPAVSTGTAATTATAPGLFQCPCAGMAVVRARASAWTSGSAAIAMHVGDGPLIK